MKTFATVRKLAGALVAVAASMLFANAASAATASGTTITNSATVNYSVNSVAQTAITSTAATFKVDTKLLITITELDATDYSATTVTPGQTNKILTFSITNNGNSTEDVNLSAIAEAAGQAASGFTGVDNTDFTNVRVFVDTNADNAFTLGTDTRTTVQGLAAGATIRAWIVSDVQSSQTDGNIAVYALRGVVSTNGSCATTCVAETQDNTTDKNANTTNLNTVYKLFADTAVGGTGDTDVAKDGVSSARDAYKVQSAQLTITKTSKIISDPIDGTDNGTTIHARAIPGAVVQYTITVSNASTAAASATGVAVTDDLTSQVGGATPTTAWNTSSLTVTSPAGTIATCQDNGAGKTTTAGVSCDYNFTTTKTVTVTGITLAANQNATIVYTVTIQ